MPTPGADGPGDGRDARALARELLTFVPDVVRLLRGVMVDDRVPRSAKVEAGLLLAYLVSPLDLVPDVLPVVGRLDDAAVLGFGLRRLLRTAGEDVVRDSWHGSDRGFAVLTQLVDVVGRPGGVLRRVASLGRLASAVRGGKGDPPSSGDPQVVEGEVVGEVWHDRPRPDDPRSGR